MSVSLVLLPGLDGTGDLFQPFLQELTSQVEPVVVSYPTDGPQDYAALVHVVLKNLPSNRPFVLLGESFSGPIAVLVAASRPANLVGIILCASFVTSPRPLARLFALISAVAPLHLLSSVAGPSILMGRFKTQTLSGLLAAAVSRVPSETLRKRYRAVAAVDVRAEFSNLSLPALYLRASEDIVVPASAAETFAHVNDRAKVEVIEAPHFLLQCAPARAANVVESFVCKVSGAA